MLALVDRDDPPAGLGSGQAGSPSSVTPYSWALPGARPSTTTSA